VNLVAFAPKGEEGKTIHSITSILENFDVSNLNVSVGFVWEKSDFNSIEEPENNLSTAIIIKQQNEPLQYCTK
jgi:hypothetical protein